MLGRVDRYVINELLMALMAVTVVMLVVVLGGVMADTLSKIARGKVAAALLLSQIGLRSLEALVLILPLALFLGVLLGLGRLYRDGEMAVLAASGYGPRQLLKPIAIVTLPLAIILAMLSFWLAPSAARAGNRMIQEASRSMLIAGMEPGRFVEIPGRSAVLYIGEMNAQGTEFGQLFLYNESEEGVDIVTAEHGEFFRDAIEERYLQLNDGFRVEGLLDSAAFRTMRFEQNSVRIPDAPETPLKYPTAEQDTMSLLADESPAARAELHWRLSAMIAPLLLAWLALPMSRAPPRRPRYGKILLALLAYLVFTNMLGLGRAWLQQGIVPPYLGLWWIYAAAFMLAWWLYHRDARQPGGLGG
jgi:lipopolysaccharide export system permease protein